MNRMYIRTTLYKAVISATVLLLTLSSQAAEMDHSNHASHGTNADSETSANNTMDHSAHQKHSMAAESNDPHAHHKAMMSNSSKDKILRSSHDYKAPSLTMLNQKGESIEVQQLLNSDKPMMVNFIFTTCPTICPVLSSTFSVVNRKLAEEKDLTMISISIDPEEDTPEALQRYAAKFEARDNWTFITGAIEDSITLQKAFNIYRGSKMNHEPVTYLRANASKPWTRLEGFPSSEQLIGEYHHMQMGH
ncbi:SCO family protein [Amphritea japonica]|uniref:Thioredoxin domain-containing protein n=1 Tax=Amphritea japonica ATCC BAA-1530 TaxID=1278309 RepID=A0A7R6P468_9GAMM|nr:SCO family protein [Amphritea japonica]BBB26764.1 conserved hypothetical protein [Amphritea japonica ATCC BAA-1530]